MLSSLDEELSHRLLLIEDGAIDKHASMSSDEPLVGASVVKQGGRMNERLVAEGWKKFHPWQKSYGTIAGSQ